ncbi:DUF3709 domain-containing protein [Vibrio cholerae]|uniref:DUF3709 domain-containing protein n=1 Tax=Vibrio cholerae TaxID=666 RepID=UPI00292A3C07|nr:DUF3709 domain-containing protein [Vibrio cholerae]
MHKNQVIVVFDPSGISFRFCRQFNIVFRCLMKRQCICRCTFQRDCLIELSRQCVVS